MFKSIKRIQYALAPDLSRSDLITLLRNLDPKNPRKERLNSLKNIMEWIRLPTKTSDTSTLPPYLQSRNIRLKFLIQLLERNPEETKYFTETLKELMARGSAVRLYCLMGISENNGFFSELSDRVVQYFIPQVYGEKDSVEIFRLLFTEEEDAEWIKSCYETIFPPIFHLIEKNSIPTEGIIQDQAEALVILGSQVAAMGISRDIRSRLSELNIIDSHFLRLNMAITNKESTNKEILQEVSQCRLKLHEVRKSIETTGVSVALIYKIEKINALLDRIEMIIYLKETDEEKTKMIIISQFISHLILDELRARTVKDFLNENLHMLTRKVVERAGEKGAHYIASNKQERAVLFNAAAWAGVLTAFTAIIKSWIGHVGFPLFFEGLFFFINYAVGFLLMQKWHLALSSKQPAFMASALSKKFEAFKQTKELSEVTAEVRNVSYSQFIAAIGNLLWVVPVIIALDWGWFWITGSHVVDNEYAHQIIDKHHPLTSLTIPFALFTGVLLFLSSAIAGWVENWIAFRNIPLMLLESRFLNNWLGKKKLKAVSDSFASTVGGIIGNISIAFMMSTPIIIGKIFGIPLDIRHVTLASGTMTLALNTIGWELSHWPQIIAMFSSMIIIGLCNFGVSFYLALRMAAIARNVESKYLKVIFKYAFRKQKAKTS